MNLLILLFSISVFATSHQGTFSALEVEPILVWEYVSTSGKDEWVRKGSRPLYHLSVDYKITITGEKSELRPLLTSNKDIDKNFEAVTLLASFFEKPDSSMLIYAQETAIKTISSAESSVGPGKKHLEFNSTWTIVDAIKVNEAFKQTIIINESELHFGEELTHLPLALTLCVGENRRLSRNVKHIGCQDIETQALQAGTVNLNQINFASANHQRDLVYFFNWQVTGKWLTGVRGPGPFVMVERK